MDINIEMMELKAGLARIEGLLNAAAASEKNRNTIATWPMGRAGWEDVALNLTWVHVQSVGTSRHRTW